MLSALCVHAQGLLICENYSKSLYNLNTKSSSPTSQSRPSSPSGKSRLNPPDLKSRLSSPDLKSRLSSPDLKSRLSSPDLKSRLSSPDLKSRLSSPDILMVRPAYLPKAPAPSAEVDAPDEKERDLNQTLSDDPLDLKPPSEVSVTGRTVGWPSYLCTKFNCWINVCFLLNCDHVYSPLSSHLPFPSSLPSLPSFPKSSLEADNVSVTDRATPPQERATSPKDRATSPQDRVTSPKDRVTSPQERANSSQVLILFGSMCMFNGAST